MLDEENIAMKMKQRAARTKSNAYNTRNQPFKSYRHTHTNGHRVQHKGRYDI